MGACGVLRPHSAVSIALQEILQMKCCAGSSTKWNAVQAVSTKRNAVQAGGKHHFPWSLMCQARVGACGGSCSHTSWAVAAGHVLQVLYCRFCTAVHCAVSTMHYVLCTVLYAVCSMHCAVCTMHYAQRPMPYALCTVPYALCTMHFAPGLFSSIFWEQGFDKVR